MKKAFLTGTILAAFAAVATGCGYRRPIEKNDFNRFQIVALYWDGREVVDTDTGNTYFQFYDDRGSVPLFDEYGRPFKANGWRDYGE